MLTEEQQRIKGRVKSIWMTILSIETITKSTDFFFSFGGYMGVSRLVEEVKDAVGDSLELENENAYMREDSLHEHAC